ncbi:Inner-membrane translocator [Vibrio nigripulchritudo MADA3029]|uniref:ABC transporter permease n=1 Tax=Vibrio nigripulchritudo TaxID=28173 RepID=UPI0003B22073|nr:ABC transporter permease [Vibrio nigripulchritudo]CCN47705.1 Inner-membrane translocator [Vibrio nigripulchritudo MADA3020]CCN56082.1 Inner-membrane translocator [Vibrio nigripulchritudo MADA3021]CCN58882.1 Inner-membrane translocator [Vibrio nigripulchritudo MADA3029]
MKRPDWVSSWDLFICLLAFAVALFGFIAFPHFGTTFNISQLIAGASERALLVLPMMLLLITRDIDLSVASILALTSVVLGLSIQIGLQFELAVVLTMFCGAALGAFNGFLSTTVGLHSLVVTLGTMALFRGIGYMLLGTGSVNVLPDALLDFGFTNVGSSSIPWTIVPFLLILPIFGIVIHKMPLGRKIFAIGGNPATALYSGISVNKIRFYLFVFSGVICSIAGIVYTARLANARANNAFGMELDVITIAILGGVSVFGGKGGVLGVVGALSLVVLVRNLLGINGIGGDAQSTSIGLMLIAALLIGNFTPQITSGIRSLLSRSRSSAE